MAVPKETDLHKEFGNIKLEADAVLEGMSICQTFDLSASDLFIRWQAFVINQHGGDASIKPTRERLLEVRSLMQLELERKSSQRRNGAPGSATKLPRLKERAHYDKSSVGALLQGLVSGSQRETMKTPQSANRVGLLKGDGALAPRGSPMFLPMTPSVFAEPSPSAIRYSKRKNMGYTEETLNPSLSSFKLPDIRKPICIIEQDRLSVGSEAASGDESDDDAPRNKGSASTGSQSAAKRMRYMFEKTATRTETVNKRIERMAIDVKTKYNIETLANPTYPHQNTVTAVGRILNVNSEDGQAVTPMSSGSLYLETSRRLGNGRRIPLDVHSAPSFALFPGQIVAVEGKNLKGSEFSALNFHQLPRLPYSPDECRDGAVEPFSAIVACGPYTLADNFDYEPLFDLVNKAIEESPCAIFLLGPFVSESHPMLKDGQTDMLPEDIFRTKISTQLTRLREGLPSTSSVFLVPSTDDLCCPYVSFPQPPLSHSLAMHLGVPEGVLSLSNPAQLSVNGVNFAISNIDVLFHIVKEEISRLPALSSCLPRLAWHLIEQQHFYPLSPPPVECAGILASHDSRLRVQAMPDILITPSRLKQFVHLHEKIILLNPGYSSRGLSGGTFAKIYVHPPDDLRSKTMMLSDTERVPPTDCTSVEIVRI
ncbi:DNA-directed DNA polymerase alpha subunit pol12 [Coemansia sp. Benny D160-2]|nr:DNA-directed DNA polymerase alpha subunit pol12 [Coemansia sp. Benny D160-2]